MFHFSYCFKKSYISKASKGACVELRVNISRISTTFQRYSFERIKLDDRNDESADYPINFSRKLENINLSYDHCLKKTPLRTSICVGAQCFTNMFSSS